MSIHTLEAGVTLIEGLVNLGRSLGYVAIREHPVEERQSNAPTVDVAWFTEEAQKFPLMIFEVESKTTNSAANNPVKVYGQSSDLFEKPLFFFHVFLASSSASTRAQNLLNLFGSHNYRIYRLDQEGVEPLFSDILAQHRRLQRSLDLSQVLEVSDLPPWQTIAPSTIAKLAEHLDYQTNFLASYACKAQIDPRYRPEHLRLLRDSKSPYGPEHQAEGYGGYIGQAWSPPVHLGLLALASAELFWLNRLKEWQERWNYMSMIGPHFGLSRDYDEFVLGQAPVLWALTTALMYKVPGAGEYIVSQLGDVLERVNHAKPEVSFFTAIWMAHIASAIKDEETYKYVQNFMNERGGLNYDLLFNPPNAVAILDGDHEWTQTLTMEQNLVPDLAEFRQRLPSLYSRVEDVDEELYEFSYSLLTSNKTLYSWAGHVALLLHTAHGHMPVRSTID